MDIEFEIHHTKIGWWFGHKNISKRLDNFLRKKYKIDEQWTVVNEQSMRCHEIESSFLKNLTNII